LSYDEYVRYNELRKTIGYRYCDEQMLNYAPENCTMIGLNADDMIRILKELFKDREWYVYDDDKNIIYSNKPSRERQEKLTRGKGVKRVETTQ
jgi:hypothetical protein